MLPAQYASEVRDIILSPPEHPHTTIKEGLLRRVCPSQRQQLQQLLHLEELGSRKPSQPLRHMLKLRGVTVTEADKDELFKQLFMQKMPPAIRMALAIHNKENLSDLVDMADAMAELQSPQAQSLGPIQVCAVEKQGNSDMAEIQRELEKLWKELKANDHRGLLQSRLATMLISVGTMSASVKRLPSVTVHTSLSTWETRGPVSKCSPTD